MHDLQTIKALNCKAAELQASDDAYTHAADNDQPVTCPQCSCRTEWDDLQNGDQLHTCRGCDYTFTVEFEEE